MGTVEVHPARRPQQGAGARGPPPWQVVESKVLVLRLALPRALPRRRHIPAGQPRSSHPIPHSRSHPGPTRPLQTTQPSWSPPRAHSAPRAGSPLRSHSRRAVAHSRPPAPPPPPGSGAASPPQRVGPPPAPRAGERPPVGSATTHLVDPRRRGSSCSPAPRIHVRPPPTPPSVKHRCPARHLPLPLESAPPPPRSQHVILAAARVEGGRAPPCRRRHSPPSVGGLRQAARPQLQSSVPCRAARRRRSSPTPPRLGALHPCRRCAASAARPVARAGRSNPAARVN